MSSDPEKAELERERRELRQIRAELERRVAELDKRQSKAVAAERRGSMGKTEGSGGASPFRAERGFSQQSSSDLDRSLMQVHPFNTSVAHSNLTNLSLRPYIWQIYGLSWLVLHACVSILGHNINHCVQ